MSPTLESMSLIAPALSKNGHTEGGWTEHVQQCWWRILINVSSEDAASRVCIRIIETCPARNTSYLLLLLLLLIIVFLLLS